MRHGHIATRLARAARADVAENPGFFADAARHGERHMQKLFETDARNALLGGSSPVLFPHMRGAMKDIVGSIRNVRYNVTNRGLAGMGEDEPVGTNDVWAASQGYTAPAITPVAPAEPGFDWTKLATSIIGAGATVGSAVYTSQIASDTAKKTAALQANALAAQARAGVGTGLLSGGSGTMLLVIAGVAVLGIGAVVMLKGSGNGGSSRRSTKRRRR